MISKFKKRLRRHHSIRQKIKGTAERPRLCVFRSLKHIYAQVIDDQRGQTICAASTLEKDVVKNGQKKNEQATIIGRLIGERALERGVERVVFDRGGYLYHGRVKALAEGAREAGLKF